VGVRYIDCVGPSSFVWILNGFVKSVCVVLCSGCQSCFVRRRLQYRITAQTNICDILHGFLRYLLRILAYINRPRRHHCMKPHDSLLIFDTVAVICCCYYHHLHQQQKRLQLRRRPSTPQCSLAITCCVLCWRFHSTPELLTLKTAKGTTLVLRH
jgi:hypothetical protein